MARQLVILAKAKYDQLLSNCEKSWSGENDVFMETAKASGVTDNAENTEQGSRDSDTASNSREKERKTYGIDTTPIPRINKENEKSLNTNETDGETSDAIATPPPKRSMRKKKSQRGGKLYIKETPTVFQKNISAKHKWLSFKI